MGRMALIGKKKLKALYAEVKPERRAALMGKIAKMLGEGLDESTAEDGPTKVRIARDAVSTLAQIEGVAKLVADEEAVWHRIRNGLQLNVAGPGGCPPGLPPHIQALWVAANAGDPAAEAEVEKYLDEARAASRSNPSGKPQP
jgi:hypothetical protein